MTQTAPRRLTPIEFVANGAAFLGAAMLLLAAFLPIARVTLLGETVEIRGPDDGWWAMAVLGLAAAVPPALATWQRRPLWTAAVMLPGVVAIGWSGWYAFAKLPSIARLADSAALEWGGLLALSAGPVLLIGALAAVIAAQQRS